MAKRAKAFDIWKDMDRRTLWRMAFAIFLLFDSLGMFLILMQSTLVALSWRFVFTQVFLVGAFATSVVLIRQNRWVILLNVVFWIAVFALSSGGLSFEFRDGTFRTYFEHQRSDVDWNAQTNLAHVTPEALNAVYAQRAMLGVFGIAFLCGGFVGIMRVMRKEVGKRTRLETEVNIARTIQQSLLPKVAFHNSWCEIAGVTVPATEVGGDYFDTIALGGGKIAVAIADVAGHGVGAGILSAMTKSALRSQLEHDTAPASVLNNLNRTIAQVADKKTFVTFGYLTIEESRLQFATAGHPPMLIKRANGKLEQLRTPNVGLGMREDSVFNEQEIACGQGDTLLLYTDGAIEAANAKGEQFGMERLEQSFSSMNGSAEQMCATLLEVLRQFRGADGFEDDVTLVCIRRV